MDKEEVIKYWQETAKDALETADSLFLIGRYHHALFFAQLALEKILKGLVLAKTEKSALPIHDLLRLSQQASLSLSEGQSDSLIEISSFNIAARYDNIKRVFYHKATKEFAEMWLATVKDLFGWLENQY